MTRLRSKIPDEYRDRQDGVLKVIHEEEFTAGLWIKPRILGFASMKGILTPNNGCRISGEPDKSWEGDIWLIDELGEIAVIEVKRDDDPRKPFEKFEQYVNGGYPNTERIRCEWRTRTLDEKSVLNSNHSEHLHRWPALDSRLTKGLKSRGYEQSVRQCFETRLGNENGMERSPMPCLAVLRLLTTASGDQLRQKLIRDWQDLEKLRFRFPGREQMLRMYVGGIRKSGATAYFAAQDVTKFGPFEDDGWEKLRESSDSVIKFLLGEK